MPNFPVSKSAALERVKRAMAAASIRNPRTAGVMSSPPTVTKNGATKPAGQSNNYTYAAKPTAFRVMGGTPIATSSGIRVKSSQISVSTGGNLTSGLQATSSRVEFMADAQSVTLFLGYTTSLYRLLVDDHITGFQTLTTSGNGAEYITLDFGSRAVRKVAVELQSTCAFVSAHVGPTESIYQTGGDILTLAAITDSYGLSSPTAIGDAYVQQMGDRLGFRNVVVSASPGTGWATDETTFYNFKTRILNGDLLLGGQPHACLFMGSYNDRNATPSVITANVLAGLQSARAQCQNVPFFVLGAFPGASGPSAGILAAEAATQAAVTAFNDNMTAFIPLSTAAIGPLISGTGSVTTPTGTGNSDLYTIGGGDLVHPNTAGHAFAGGWGDKAVRAAIQSIAA